MLWQCMFSGGEVTQQQNTQVFRAHSYQGKPNQTQLLVGKLTLAAQACASNASPSSRLCVSLVLPSHLLWVEGVEAQPIAPIVHMLEKD